MPIFNAIALAFSTFSHIPVPRIAWKSRNLRYMLCAFPLVGVVIGVAEMGVLLLVSRFMLFGQRSVSLPVVALVLLLIPVLITGGIHLDGFMDTCDALGCYADRERRLAVMGDSHAGAFAVLGCALYVLACYVLLLELCRRLVDGSGDAAYCAGKWHAQMRLPLCLALSFVLSRLLSAFSVAVFPLAKADGLVRTFAFASARRFTAVWSAVWSVVLSIAVIVHCGRSGAAVVGAELIVFVWYFAMTRRAFGGITGDTAGWFVQMAELAALSALVVSP